MGVLNTGKHWREGTAGMLCIIATLRRNTGKPIRTRVKIYTEVDKKVDNRCMDEMCVHPGVGHPGCSHTYVSLLCFLVKRPCMAPPELVRATSAATTAAAAGAGRCTACSIRVAAAIPCCPVRCWKALPLLLLLPDALHLLAARAAGCSRCHAPQHTTCWLRCTGAPGSWQALLPSMGHTTIPTAMHADSRHLTFRPCASQRMGVRVLANRYLFCAALQPMRRTGVPLRHALCLMQIDPTTCRCCYILVTSALVLFMNTGCLS